MISVILLLIYCSALGLFLIIVSLLGDLIRGRPEISIGRFQIIGIGLGLLLIVVCVLSYWSKGPVYLWVGYKWLSLSLLVAGVGLLLINVWGVFRPLRGPLVY